MAHTKGLPMSQNADLIQRYYDAFNRRDFASYERLFTRDCLVEGPGMQLTGIDGARGFDQGFIGMLPDAQILNLHKSGGSNVVLCENRFRGTGFDERYMAVFELEGERIKRQSLHYDRVTLMEKLGPAAKNIEIVRGIYAAFGTRDMQYILDHLADDVSWGITSIANEVPAYGLVTGKHNVPAFFQAWGQTAEHRAFEASDFVAAGDHVFCTLHYDLTVKATGKRLVNSGCAQHWTLVNGKIVRWRGWEDTAATRDAYLM